MSSETEISVTSSYSVIYRVEKKVWAVAGDGGWSEVHLYRDAADDTYRLVGWTVKGQKVLMNCNVTSDCVYKSKTRDFHKFVDENGVHYGLGFHKGGEAATQAAKFLEVMCDIIEKCQSHQNFDGKQALVPYGRSNAKSIFVSSPRVQACDYSIVPLQSIPMGKLEILPAKPGKISDIDRGPSSITDPWGIVHTKHATYDASTRSYKGVPAEWLRELQKQFGIEPKDLESIVLPEYKARIPSILVQMKKFLYDNGGLDVEGIFRLAPDSDQSGIVKQQLNEGSFTECHDVNCMANLIKVWFRDLPNCILGCVAPSVIADAVEKNQIGNVIISFPEPNRSIIEWLLDVCVDVSNNSAVNLMPAKNLGIVIAPNLFHFDDLSPMEQLIHSQKVAQFLHKAIEWRSKNPPKNGGYGIVDEKH